MRLDPASFRDPSGFVYSDGDSLYRQINQSYKDDYTQLIDSGLYQALLSAGMIIPHEEVSGAEPAIADGHFLTIKPLKIEFVSYPYEWSFSQLKDAALLTLNIQKTAMKYGMSLKDASAYNVQFIGHSPIFIDTLSFERLSEGEPWVAYRQFCQHFLIPLALMSYRDVSLGQLTKNYIDGIPLSLGAALLPFSSKFNLSLLMHVHMHFRSQNRYSDTKHAVSRDRKMSKASIYGLIDNLESAVTKLQWNPPRQTEWSEYYGDTNYSEGSFERKHQLVAEFIKEANPRSVVDLGANTGVFSRIASSMGIYTLSSDYDPMAVEKNYLDAKSRGDKKLLPLLIDLSNPSPSIGWNNEERISWGQRSRCDMVFALALIHHLVISNNISMGMVRDFFSHMCRYLVIEFVPKEDSQTQRLLRVRKDIFPEYTQEGFEREFTVYFKILRAEKLQDSNRILYLLENKRFPAA